MRCPKLSVRKAITPQPFDLQALEIAEAPPWLPSGRRVSKEFVVVLPVSLHFEHDALIFGVSAQLVPVLVALKPRKIMIFELDGSSQPSQSRLLVA